MRASTRQLRYRLRQLTLPDVPSAKWGLKTRFNLSDGNARISCRLIVHDDVLIGNVEHDQLSGVVDVVQEGGEDGYFLNVKLCCSSQDAADTHVLLGFLCSNDARMPRICESPVKSHLAHQLLSPSYR